MAIRVKLLTALLAGVLALGAVACGGSEPAGGAADDADTMQDEGSDGAMDDDGMDDGSSDDMGGEAEDGMDDGGSTDDGM